MKKRYSKGLEESSSYWLSIGDLMASVLIVFILIFVYQVLDINEKIEAKDKIIQEMTNVKNKIIEKLNGEFEKENLRIIIDQKNGSIKLDEKILFSTGESNLKPEGKEYLEKFIPLYSKLLLSDKDIRAELSQIIVEGHTDDVGSYMYNLNLSQKRAFAVVNFIFTEMGDFPQKEQLREYITANGRSNIKLIRDEYDRVDREKSRRVEFQFKLKDDETLVKVQNQLREGI